MENFFVKLIDRIRPRNIRTQFIFWFISLALVPILIVTFYARPNVEKTLRELQIIHFKALSEFQVQKVEDFRNHLVDDMENLKDEIRIVETLMLANSNHSNKKNTKKSHSSENDYKNFYKRQFQITKDYNISDFLLIDTNNQIIYSINNANIGRKIADLESENLNLTNNYNRFIQQKSLYISPAFFDVRSQTPALIILMPVYQRNQFVGTFAKVVVLTGILTDMASDYLMGETGEMLVAQLKGDTIEFLNTLRFNSEHPLNLKLRLEDKIALPIQNALKGKSGAMVSVDYRGQKVIAEWK